MCLTSGNRLMIHSPNASVQLCTAHHAAQHRTQDHLKMQPHSFIHTCLCVGGVVSASKMLHCQRSCCNWFVAHAPSPAQPAAAENTRYCDEQLQHRKADTQQKTHEVCAFNLRGQLFVPVVYTAAHHKARSRPCAAAGNPTPAPPPRPPKSQCTHNRRHEPEAKHLKAQ